MKPTWSHPELGKFRHGAFFWVTKVHVPEFDAFSYVTRHTKGGPPNGEYSLRLPAGNVPQPPSVGSVALALRLLECPTKILRMTINALWDDFNGRGPDSHMWWRGILLRDTKKDAFDGKPPERPDDLLPLLRLTDIAAFDEWGPRKVPILHLVFRAEFENEHGVGILTDIDRIIGIGFVGEVELFDPSDVSTRGGSTSPTSD